MKIEKSAETLRKEEIQVKLAALDEKKKQGKLTLENIYEQNQIIIKMLKDLRM